MPVWKNPSYDIVLIALVTAVLTMSSLFAQSFRVRHDHSPWGACQGELTITEKGIRFDSETEEGHSQSWDWLDIQTVDRQSAERFSILTYQDQKWLLGKDRSWNFSMLHDESEGLSNERFDLIMQRLERPVVNRQVRDVEAEYEVPVKHLHTFGGCEGELRFSRGWIVYATDHARDQRSWRKQVEVVNVWSTGPYDLEVEVYEREGGDLLKTRRFRFQLKVPLDENYYDRLRRDMLPPRNGHRGHSVDSP